MSRLSLAAVMTAFAMPFVSCNDLEDDDHYANTNTVINNPELKIVQTPSNEYIQSHEELSGINELFKEYGIYEELSSKGQLGTILVVDNDNFVAPEGSQEDIDYVVRSHVSDMSVSPANLNDGDRLMMWHGKYTNVTFVDPTEDDRSKAIGADALLFNGHAIKFNNGYVKEVIQTTNGYIYVISEMIQTPTSLSDFINSLDDNYSIFKDLVLSSGGKEFDKANSKPIGISPDGNTLYDSVFIYTNAHFDDVEFDMNSESLTATMLLPSDEVINAALADAHARLNSWGVERSDSVIKAWIRDVSFYNKRLTGDQLMTAAVDPVNDPSANDFRSIFSKQWRPGKHVVDVANPIELSNGIVYPVTKIHIPINVLIYRLKDWFYLYENCNDTQKADYFKMSNMVFKSCSDDVASWTPLPGVWPEIKDRALSLSVGEDGAGASFSLDFTPIMLTEGNSIRPYMIPPGSYRLAFGSKQNQNLTIRASVIVGGNVVANSDGAIELGSSTAYHYDRGATLSDRYPEGYDPTEVSNLGGTKASNYDTDGGLLIQEVTIPDLNGDGSAVPIVIRIEADNWREQSSFTLAHWCLRPTVNNY